jgi:hypothetical protein
MRGRFQGVLTSIGALFVQSATFDPNATLVMKLNSTINVTVANGTHCSSMMLSCTTQPSGLLY